MWFRLFEAWAVAKLLSSPSFHRAVQTIHKRIYRLQHGTPMEEMGGTKIEKNGPSLLKHFKDEIKEQLKTLPPKRLR